MITPDIWQENYNEAPHSKGLSTPLEEINDLLLLSVSSLSSISLSFSYRTKVLLWGTRNDAKSYFVT